MARKMPTPMRLALIAAADSFDGRLPKGLHRKVPVALCIRNFVDRFNIITPYGRAALSDELARISRRDPNQIVQPSRDTVGERSTTHGHRKGRLSTITYRSWCSMITRCTNPNFPAYKDYGGAGITICERWLKFEDFLEDMGERPSIHLSLDRYPNNQGNYEPGNVRWATPREQRLNQKRVRKVIRSDGARYDSVSDAARASGGKPHSIFYACNASHKSYMGFKWRYLE